MFASLKNAFGGKEKGAALPPFTGRSAQLGMALDVGTTSSAVTVIYMSPGEPPDLHEVRFGTAKDSPRRVPTQMWYKDGQAVAFGSSGDIPSIREAYLQTGHEEAAAFKLHLHPEIIKPPTYEEDESRYYWNPNFVEPIQTTLPLGIFDLAPLPSGVDAEQCYADWFRWLMDQARESFCRSQADGPLIWDKLGTSIAYVVTHPNAWSEPEKNKIERALERAGYFDLPGHGPATEPSAWGKEKGKGKENAAAVSRGMPRSEKLVADDEPGVGPTNLVASSSEEELPAYNESESSSDPISVPPLATDEDTSLLFESANRADRTERLIWLSETEASLNYLLFITPKKQLDSLWSSSYTSSRGVQGRTKDIIVVDAGGSTVDIQVFNILSGFRPRPSTREADRPAKCVQAGAIFPSYFFRLFLRKRLAGSTFDNEECINRLVAAFDRDIKPRFHVNPKSPQATWAVPFASVAESDVERGIVNGNLLLSTTEVASFFDPATTSITTALVEKFIDIPANAYMHYHILLVGGFGESRYLQSKIKTARYSWDKISLFEIPPSADSKPVATGAAAWFCSYWLEPIICRACFGVPYNRPSHEGLPYSRPRVEGVDGVNRYEGGWYHLIGENDYMFNAEENTVPLPFDSLTSTAEVSISLIMSPHNITDGYMNDPEGNWLPRLQVIHTLSTRLGPSDGMEAITPIASRTNEQYWHLDLLVVLKNNGDGLVVFLRWSDGLKTRETPPQRIPEKFLAGGPRRLGSS